MPIEYEEVQPGTSGTDDTVAGPAYEEVTPEEPGFTSAFKRGMAGFNIGRDAVFTNNAAVRNAELDKTIATSKDPAEVEAAKLEKQRNLKQIRTNINDIRKESADSEVLYPKTEGYKEFEKAKGWQAATAAVIRHPVDVSKDILGESFGGQAKTLPLAIAGGVGGSAGMAVTTGLTSFATEAGSDIAQKMMEMGVNLDDPEAVSKAMASPEFQAIKAEQMKKAAVVGAFDAATAALTGVKLRPSKIGNVTAQMAAQMAGGGGGEALGSVAAGEEISPQAVIAEMWGELPGGMAEVGMAGLHQSMNSQQLSHAAQQQEDVALTGFNEVQQAAADETTQANKKPRLSPNQAKVVAAAHSMGMDPVTPLAIAGIETGGKYNFDAKNPKSSAQGIFQITDETWGKLGGGDRNDPNLQITRGLELIKQTQGIMHAALGREPTPGETYMGHLLGPQTALDFLTSPDSTPGIEAARKSNPRTASAIINNNGMTGKTVGEIKQMWQDKIHDHIVAAGGDPELNIKTRASKEADAAPVEDLNSGLEDLDSMFEYMESQPLTAEDINAALKEEEYDNTNPEAKAESELLNDEDTNEAQDLVGEEPTPELIPTLPDELRGATPRYGFGKDLFEVHFSNDLDKAAYIIADGAKRSARDQDYLDFFTSHDWVSEDEARAYGKQVRSEVKALAQAAKGTGVASIVHSNPDGQTLTPTARIRQNSGESEVARSRADSFVSMDAVRNRSNYDNPNDTYKNRAGRLPIVAARDETALGQTLSDRKLAPGEVVAAGVESAHTPMPYMTQIQSLFQDAVDKFAPKARLVVTFATEAPTHVSSYAQMKNIGVKNRMARGRGLYKINMRNATNLGITDTGTINSTTQSQIISAAWHEFGHVVADEQMTQAMSPELKEKFQNLPTDSYFSEEDLASLPPEQATVLREYNDLKWKTLNDPSFTAEDFGYSWLSPWKLGHGIGTKGVRTGLESFVKKYMGETEVMMLQMPAKVFAMKLNARSDILSPHEYMAEQMSRYAYSRGLYEQSDLARGFFARALETLRNFFQKLKRGGEIKPGIAFAEWVDSLSGLSQAIGENKALPKEPAAVKPRIKMKPEAVRKARRLIVEDKALAEQQPLIPPDKFSSEEAKTVAIKEYSDDQLKNLRLLATDLKYLQKTRPAKYQHYMDLIRNNQLEQFYEEGQMELPDEIADKIRFDTDVPDQVPNWAELELSLPKIIGDKFSLRGIKVGAWSARRFMNFVTNMRQMAYAHPDVAGLQTIEMLMGNYSAFKNKLNFKGLEVTDRWSKLAKEQHGLLEQALREEHASGENWADLKKVNGVFRFVPNEKLQKCAHAKGLDQQSREVWLGMKNAHLSHMNALQHAIKQKMASRFRGKPKTLQVKLHDLEQIFTSIRNQPFLPQTRFGQFALHVKEAGLEGDKILHVEFFEAQAQRDEKIEQLKRVIGPGRKVTPAMYSPTSAILRTLPPQILSTYAQEFELTDSQKKEVRQLADAVTRSPQLRKYSAQLAAITGANKDLHRNFADFMGHSASNIAKFHYKEHFTKGLFSIQADAHQAADDGDIARYEQLAGMVKFSKAYINHMMNPADEWQKVRAFVVIKQLWGNVKTALANLTSLANLWALAGAQTNSVNATGTVGKAALKELSASIQSAYHRVMRQPSEGAQVWAPDTKWALDQAKSDGLLVESFAAQLANFAQSSTLSRMNFQRGDAVWKKAVWYGMLPQHATEVFIRRTTLVHQFEQYMKKGMNRTDAYVKARSDTYRIQGDNSMMNKPAFMRGKAGPFLIYYGFMQNQIYLLSGAQERARNLHEALDSHKADNMTTAEARKKFYRMNWISGETVKMWAAYGMLGGLMGLPGAENLDDLLELVSRKMFGHRFSLKEHAFGFAKYVSDHARSIGLDVNPRSIVHGAGADINMFGLMPDIDVSSSIGMGNMLPGGRAISELGKSPENFIYGAMGPLGNVVKQSMDAFSDDPSMLKKTALFMPNTVNGIAKAFYEWEHGVRAPSGGKITVDRHTGEVRDLTTGESLIRLMGFNPEIISANKEIHWMQRDVQQYWSGRRNLLITQIFEARLQGDREAIADTDASLKSFNENAPKALKITSRDLHKALKRKKTIARKDEAGKSRQRKFQKLDDEMKRDIMGEPEEE